MTLLRFSPLTVSMAPSYDYIFQNSDILWYQGIPHAVASLILMVGNRCIHFFPHCKYYIQERVLESRSADTKTYILICTVHFDEIIKFVSCYYLPKG